MTEKEAVGECTQVEARHHTPVALPLVCPRPVSGLASLDAPPSQAETQWRCGASALAYRCGGSSGLVDDRRTAFPFNRGWRILPQHL